jgi:hypothetical protein
MGRGGQGKGREEVAGGLRRLKEEEGQMRLKEAEGG